MPHGFGARIPLGWIPSSPKKSRGCVLGRQTDTFEGALPAFSLRNIIFDQKNQLNMGRWAAGTGLGEVNGHLLDAPVHTVCQYIPTSPGPRILPTSLQCWSQTIHIPGRTSNPGSTFQQSPDAEQYLFLSTGEIWHLFYDLTLSPCSPFFVCFPFNGS